MKITKLEYQKKDPNRVNVYVDEKFVAGLSVSDIVRLGFYSGQEITPEQLNKIIGESDFGKLFDAGLNFLSYRPRSEWEVRQFLRRRIKNQELRIKKERREVNNTDTKSGEKQQNKIIETVVNKLRKIGQINDEEFASWFIDQRETFRPTGKRGLKYELLRKGVDRNVIDKVLNEPVKEDLPQSDFESAMRAIEKRIHSSSFIVHRKIDPNKEREKLQRFLASRGFDWETIKRAVEKVLGKEYNEE